RPRYRREADASDRYRVDRLRLQAGVDPRATARKAQTSRRDTRRRSGRFHGPERVPTAPLRPDPVRRTRRVFPGQARPGKYASGVGVAGQSTGAIRRTRTQEYYDTNA